MNDEINTESLPSPGTAMPPEIPADKLPGPDLRHRPGWVAPLSFAAGGGLTALALAIAFHTGTFDAFATTRTVSVAATAIPDSRVDRLLSLLASERDCDSECLADLKGKADKSVALEQVLGQIQESATAAEQRVAALETEKAGISQEMTRKLTELEEGHKQKLAALEAEKTRLTDQIGRKTDELEAERKSQDATLERMKEELAGKIKRETAQIEASYRQRVAALEKRLAESETSPPTQRPRKEKEHAAARKNEQPRPASMARFDTPPERERSINNMEADAKKWTVLGMTASTVVVSTGNHRVVALAEGESLDGIKINRIDLDQGVAETSAGKLAYRQ